MTEKKMIRQYVIHEIPWKYDDPCDDVSHWFGIACRENR
jgi:hypothetical protein